MSSEKVLHLTKENFQETIRSSKPVLVDFWAPWCGPCRMVGPIIDELASEYEQEAVICKLNVDEQGEIASNYNVMSIPTIIVFKNGLLVDKVIGAKSKQELSSLIRKNI